jgi:5-methylcytosine-specific restriction endonuclease McrA
MPYKDPAKRLAASRKRYATKKAEVRAYINAWRQANPERRAEERRRYKARPDFKAKQQAYYQENKEQLLAYLAQYREAHREELRAKDRERLASNRDAINARRRQRYAANPEHFRAQKRRSSVVNLDKILFYNKHRRAKKTGATLNDLTLAQWQEIKAHYGQRCVYCGRKMQRLTLDHIIPLSKGGNHTATNIVPACLSCNSRKNNREPLVPVQPLLLTVAPARKKRRKDD